jgi:hypothetical protein
MDLHRIFPPFRDISIEFGRIMGSDLTQRREILTYQNWEQNREASYICNEDFSAETCYQKRSMAFHENQYRVDVACCPFLRGRTGPGSTEGKPPEVVANRLILRSTWHMKLITPPVRTVPAQFSDSVRSCQNLERKGCGGASSSSCVY